MRPACAHEMRTNRPLPIGSNRHRPERIQCVDLQERQNLGAPGTIRNAANRTANAVWVRAHPGFKSPSLR